MKDTSVHIDLNDDELLKRETNVFLLSLYTSMQLNISYRKTEKCLVSIKSIHFNWSLTGRSTEPENNSD